MAYMNFAVKRVTTLKITPSDVVATLCKLPDTVHLLDDPAKFVFDAWTIPGFLVPAAAGVGGETVLFASVHGQFTECM
jgi:nuclear RNA export factor